MSGIVLFNRTTERQMSHVISHSGAILLDGVRLLCVCVIAADFQGVAKLPFIAKAKLLLWLICVTADIVSVLNSEFRSYLCHLTTMLS